MRDTLFRQEAVDFNRTTLIGDALAARRLSFRLLTGFLDLHRRNRRRLPLLRSVHPQGAGERLSRALFGVENIAVVSLGALAVLDGGFSVGMLAGSRAPCRTVDLDDGRSRDRGRTRRRGFALNFNSSSIDEAFTSIP